MADDSTNVDEVKIDIGEDKPTKSPSYGSLVPPAGGSTPSSRRRREHRGVFTVSWAASKLLKFSNVVDTYDCPLCLCKERVEAGFTVPGCSHVACKACLGEYLSAEISEAHVLHLTCPAEDDDGNECKVDLKADTVRQLVTDDVFVKYQRFTATQTNTDLRECPKCKSLEAGDPRHPQMTCSKCGTGFCFLHSGAHPGMTCREFKRKNAAATKATDDFIKRQTVVCPRPTCGLPVIKASGCNHMTCSRCHMEFCYLCGEIIIDTSVHFSEWNLLGCRDQQFGGDGANSNRWPYPCRVFLWPLCVLILCGIATACVAVAGAVWSAYFWPVFILCCPCICYMLCNGDIDEDGIPYKMAICYPALLFMCCLTFCSPLLVPFIELGKLFTTLFCWCRCCPRRRG